MISGNYSQYIKEQAYRLGFFYCGIARAEKLDDDAFRLEKWLSNNYHGKMHYMANHFDKRIDPRLLVDDAKSVITLLINYFPEKEQKENTPKISKYAYGKDYHIVIKEKLKELLTTLQDDIGQINGRCFVDSAPVLERSWAVKSGAGWVGKNGNVINKTNGSFFFIATLIVDIELTYDLPLLKDYCGTCNKCVESCPTDAILPNKEINGSQCISYYTIELKDAIIETDKEWKDWIFGCDICQDICPWNRFAKPHTEKEFYPNDLIINYTSKDWMELTDEVFKKHFKDSPLSRTKLQGIKRNIIYKEQ